MNTTDHFINMNFSNDVHNRSNNKHQFNYKKIQQEKPINSIVRKKRCCVKSSTTDFDTPCKPQLQKSCNNCHSVFDDINCSTGDHMKCTRVIRKQQCKDGSEKEIKCNTKRLAFCSECGNQAENYEKVFQPWKFANKNPNFGFYRLYIAGGIPGTLISWQFIVLLVATIAWFLYFYFTGYDITQTSIFSATYNPSIPQLPSLLTNLLSALSGILFASGVAFAITIYRNNFIRYDDIASSYTHVSSEMIGFLRWNKICDHAIPCHDQNLSCTMNGCDKSKDVQPNVLIVLRDLIYFFTLKPYWYKHFFRGRTEIHAQEGVHEGLPLPPDVKSQLINIKKEQGDNDLTNDDKNNDIDTAIFSRIAWLAENGYLLNKDGIVQGINDIIIRSRGLLGEMSTEQTTPTPILIRQIMNTSTMTLYVLLIPAMWSMYSYILGSIALYIVIPLVIAFLNGLPRVQSVFDNPEKNPTISNKNIGFRSHGLAKQINGQWVRALNKRGFVLDNVHDKFSRISKISEVKIYQETK